MLFAPWKNEEKDLISCFDIFKAHYNSLKTSIESKSNAYEHQTDAFELAGHMMEDEENAYDQISQKRLERQKKKE